MRILTRSRATLVPFIGICAIFALIVTAKANRTNEGDDAHRSSSLTATTTELPREQIRLDIINHSSTPFTALVAEGILTLPGDRRSIHSVRFFDSSLKPEDNTNGAGSQQFFVFFGPSTPATSHALRTVGLKAAIFADGSTWGDIKWVSMLLQRRQEALKFEQNCLDILMKAKLEAQNEQILIHSLTDAENRYSESASDVSGKQLAGLIFDEAKFLVERDTARSQTQVSFIGISHNKAGTDLAIQRMLLRIRALDEAKPAVAGSAASPPGSIRHF